MESLAAHATVEDGRPWRVLLKEMREMRQMLHDRFGIDHITIHLEPEDFSEREAPI